MFSKLAMIVLVALTGLHVVVAGPITPAYTCPSGRYLYCCSATLPGGYIAAGCTPYNEETGCSGEVKCCAYNGPLTDGFGCSAPTSN